MCPHATRGREVIGKLITQGHDKVCPERMDVQELLVAMTATIRHMPLVTQLHKNTSVITTEIRKFRTVVHTFLDQMRDNLETTLETLLKGTRRVPEFELSILEDVKLPRRRPQTSKLARPTRSEIHRRIDRFSGIEQEDNARALDSLFLEFTEDCSDPKRHREEHVQGGNLSVPFCGSTGKRKLETHATLVPPEGQPHQWPAEGDGVNGSIHNHRTRFASSSSEDARAVAAVHSLIAADLAATTLKNKKEARAAERLKSNLEIVARIRASRQDANDEA